MLTEMNNRFEIQGNVYKSTIKRLCGKRRRKAEERKKERKENELLQLTKTITVLSTIRRHCVIGEMHKLLLCRKASMVGAPTVNGRASSFPLGFLKRHPHIAPSRFQGCLPRTPVFPFIFLMIVHSLPRRHRHHVRLTPWQKES